MPYVRGPEPRPTPPKPELYGFLHTRGQWKGWALMIAIRRGIRYTRDVEPTGLVSLQEAAALVHRRDPATGELRPVSRIAVYEWARAGKLATVTTPRRVGTRPVVQVRLSVLRRFADDYGFEFRPVADAAGM